MNFTTSLIIMIILISLLVLVHEWGHYIAARLFGVRVSKFGFGMPIGPTLFKTKKGDLEILVHACLLGGYVSFPDDEEGSEASVPMDSSERFKNKKPYQKAIIVSAGVIMNLLFAFVLIVLASLIFHKLPTGESEIFVDEIISDGVVAKTMPDKFQKGDKILKVNGLDINSSYKFIFLIKNSSRFDSMADETLINENLEKFLKLNPNIDKNMVIEEGVKINLPSKTDEKPFVVNNDVLMGLEQFKNNEIKLTEEEASLRDEILGKKEYVLTKSASPLSIAKALSDGYKPLSILIQRDDKEILIENVNPSQEGTIGIKLASKEIFKETKTLPSVLISSFDYMVKSTKLMLYGFYQLVSGKIPASEMHGIVVIVKVGSDIINQQGMLNGLLLTAIISINLAIVNLLPIPALDGGHLMFIIIEKIIGKPLDEKAIDGISRFFFLLLIFLLVLVLFNDVFALCTNKF